MDSSLILKPTAVAQWHSLVCEAQTQSGHNLDESLQSYLVFLLMRFADKPNLLNDVMASDYLDAMQADNRKQDKLRDVGDKCLLFSGFFPQVAARKLVRISYFVNIGRSAYDQVADSADSKVRELYKNLVHAFVPVMDVLHTMRSLDGNPPLSAEQAVELWSDTGSQSAYRMLKQHYQVIPFPV
ncbi:MAG: hypothetical protein V3U75_07305 [Methylococcaceae bacterium]